MRRFEFVEGTSAKFWQIERTGNELHITSGRVGATGQSQLKSFVSESGASRQFDKLIREKTKKGFVEVAGDPAEAMTPSIPESVAPAESSVSETVETPATANSTPPKRQKSARKKPRTDSRLVSAWRKAAKLVLAKGFASTYEIIKQPGAWDAFAAALESGDVPLQAVWKFGQDVIEHFPPALAPLLLAAVPPPEAAPLWHAYQLAVVPVATRLLADPHAFDAMEATAPESARDILSIVRVQAGLTPRSALPDRILDSVRDTFPRQAPHRLPIITPGRIEFVLNLWDALVALGDALFGHEVYVAALAEGYRRILASVRPTERPYPDGNVLAIASEALTPEEVCRFQLRSHELANCSRRWSVEDLVRVAVATRASGGSEARLVAGTAAVIALRRDPSCAPRVEAAIQLLDLNNQASSGVADTYYALAATPPDWLRHYLDTRIFGADNVPCVWDGAIGITLLTRLDPEAAEQVAGKFDIAYFRLSGLSAEEIASVIDGAGPKVRAGLRPQLVSALASRRDQFYEERFDAYLEFDGGEIDAYLAKMIERLPDDRGMAILRREIAAGREAFVRKAIGGNETWMLALFGEESVAPVVPTA